MDCPSCISFNDECHPDPEDYNEPCPYYKAREEVLEAELEPFPVIFEGNAAEVRHYLLTHPDLADRNIQIREKE